MVRQGLATRACPTIPAIERGRLGQPGISQVGSWVRVSGVCGQAVALLRCCGGSDVSPGAGPKWGQDPWAGQGLVGALKAYKCLWGLGTEGG